MTMIFYGCWQTYENKSAKPAECYGRIPIWWLVRICCCCKVEGAISESLMSDIESSDSSSSESSISIPINGSFKSETFKKGNLSRRVINFITKCTFKCSSGNMNAHGWKIMEGVAHIFPKIQGGGICCPAVITLSSLYRN